MDWGEHWGSRLDLVKLGDVSDIYAGLDPKALTSWEEPATSSPDTISIVEASDVRVCNHLQSVTLVSREHLEELGEETTKLMDISMLDKPKLLIADRFGAFEATIGERGMLLAGRGYVLTNIDTSLDPWYVLALLNFPYWEEYYPKGVVLNELLVPLVPKLVSEFFSKLTLGIYQAETEIHKEHLLGLSDVKKQTDYTGDTRRLWHSYQRGGLEHMSREINNDRTRRGIAKQFDSSFLYEWEHRMENITFNQHEKSVRMSWKLRTALRALYDQVFIGANLSDTGSPAGPIIATRQLIGLVEAGKQPIVKFRCLFNQHNPTERLSFRGGDKAKVIGVEKKGDFAFVTFNRLLSDSEAVSITELCWSSRLPGLVGRNNVETIRFSLNDDPGFFILLHD